MLAPIPIPGIALHETPEALHVQSREMLMMLSSSFLGGGFRRARHIVNAKVAEDYCADDPAADLRAIAGRCGVNEPFVGLLTAVPLRKARLAFVAEDGLRAAALVTAGVSNASSAGVTRPYAARPGTINIILLLDAKLTRAALVNAIITATEAKCAVLRSMDIRTADGAAATGTSTDTVTVAATGRGAAQPYAGPATVLGWSIAKTVRQAVRESLLAA